MREKPKKEAKPNPKKRGGPCACHKLQGHATAQQGRAKKKFCRVVDRDLARVPHVGGTTVTNSIISFSFNLDNDVRENGETTKF